MARETTHYDNWALELAKDLDLIKPGKKWKTGKWFKTYGVVNIPFEKDPVWYTKVMFRKSGSVVLKGSDGRKFIIDINDFPDEMVTYEIRP